MSGPIERVLGDEHRHIKALLSQAKLGERASYDELRPALLRHIGIEEKILLPALRAQGPEPPYARQLRLDHSAIVAMLVPSPTSELLIKLEALLALHDPLEEGPGGLYALADALPDLDGLLARIAGAPSPPLAAHFDGPRAFAAIETLLGRARGGRSHQ